MASLSVNLTNVGWNSRTYD